MMNYANYMGQNPYNMVNPHPSYFANALQQPYFNQQQQQQQPTQSQQQITTQPPIMQPQAMVSKITQVLNKEEATGSPVDLINGSPSFFYNKSNGEIYLKQFDVPSGTAIFKTYVQVQEKEQSKQDNISPTSKQNVSYEKELHYISDGVDSLHRMIDELRSDFAIRNQEEVIDIEPEPLEDYSKSKNNKKRGQ